MHLPFLLKAPLHFHFISSHGHLAKALILITVKKMIAKLPRRENSEGVGHGTRPFHAQAFLKKIN